jgi:alpha-L-arabinofuranosidase
VIIEFSFKTVILGIWSGLSLGSDGINPVVPQDQLQPYIDDAIAEIEFITADAKTNKWGALRASLGRPVPYEIKYVEMFVQSSRSSES